MTIEGNKDESDKCINIAQAAFSVGNTEKAEKFLLKAERLYPSPRAKELLTRVRAAGPSIPTPKKATPESSTEDVRRRKIPSHTTPQREFTQDQIDAVRRINTKCKDYYEILGVTKEATDSDIKKAYKKLALQLHPDKNHAPGAVEAFKAIGNAAAILTDPEKRKQYDIRGDEPAPTAHQHHTYYARGFESDLTAEELFNMFFGAAGGGPPAYARRRAREPDAREGHGGLVQLLPVAVLVLLSMMSGFFINEPVYSLAPSAKYVVPRETVHMKVPYYVKENFHTDYQGSLRRLEMAIEEEYIVGLRHACQRERNYRDSMSWKARNFGDSKQYADAQKLRTPSCEKLNAFQRGLAVRRDFALVKYVWRVLRGELHHPEVVAGLRRCAPTDLVGLRPTLTPPFRTNPHKFAPLSCAIGWINQISCEMDLFACTLSEFTEVAMRSIAGNVTFYKF